MNDDLEKLKPGGILQACMVSFIHSQLTLNICQTARGSVENNKIVWVSCPQNIYDYTFT